MPKSSKRSYGRQQALNRLGARLDAFEATRAPKASSLGEAQGLGEGYRLLAILLSGVLGGVGLGWAFDHFAHTSPIGLIGGLLIGTVVSVVSVVSSASRTGSRTAARTTPLSPAPTGTDEDDGGPGLKAPSE